MKITSISGDDVLNQRGCEMRVPGSHSLSLPSTTTAAPKEEISANAKPRVAFCAILLESLSECLSGTVPSGGGGAEVSGERMRMRGRSLV